MITKLLFWLAVGLVVFYVSRAFSGLRQRTLQKTEEAAREAVRRAAEKAGHIAPAEDLAHCALCDQHVPKSVAEACETEGCPMKAHFQADEGNKP